jgi:hypothetical protein
MKLPKIQAGDAAWTDLAIDFTGNTDEGVVGQDVWSAGPTCFDFVNDYLTLALDGDAGLAIKREPHRTLPIAWDRRGGGPKLVVLLVKPGSEMERAGCQAGDIVIGVDDVKGISLTRGTLNELLFNGKPHVLLVLRQGTNMGLQFPKSFPSDSTEKKAKKVK